MIRWSPMIRWSYVAPRAAILAVAMLSIWWVKDAVIRRGLIAGGQQLTEAKVEIGKVQTSLLRGEVSLSDVRVADPHHTMRNLVEAQEIVLGLETAPLLSKHWIVREARASGLRFGTSRDTSGALEKDAKARRDRGELPELPDAGQAIEWAQAWLDTLANLLENQLDAEVERLESVRLGRELAERWPREYDEIEARIEQLKRRAEELRKLAQGGARSILRDPEAVARALGEVEGLHRDIAEARREFDRLGTQVVRDKNGLEQARRHDMEEIRRRLRLDELAQGNLSDFLLGPELAERVRTVTSWVRWARAHWPQRVEPASPTRRRGVDVLFAGLKPQPDLLVRRLAVDGEVEDNGDRFSFAGAVEGLSAQPQLVGQPTTVSLRVRGMSELVIEATLDRTQPVPRDRFRVEIPAMREPSRLLGQPDRVALAVSPGSTRVVLDLDLEGDRLGGGIHLRQEPVRLVPHVAPRYGGERLAADLEATLAGVQAIDVVVDLAGTLDRPQWRLRSDLGDQLADALQGLLGRELEARREQFVARVERDLETEQARLTESLQRRQQAVLARLDLTSDQIRLLRSVVTDRLPVEKLIGRPLPVEIPLRF